MQGNPVEALPLAGSAPHDLSIIALFLQSDTIVKVVIFLLLAASIWSWAVIFDKLGRIRRLRRDAESFEETFWSGGSLDDLYDRIGARPPIPCRPCSPPPCASGAAACPRASSRPPP